MFFWGIFHAAKMRVECWRSLKNECQKTLAPFEVLQQTYQYPKYGNMHRVARAEISGEIIRAWRDEDKEANWIEEDGGSSSSSSNREEMQRNPKGLCRRGEKIGHDSSCKQNCNRLNSETLAQLLETKVFIHSDSFVSPILLCQSVVFTLLSM